MRHSTKTLVVSAAVFATALVGIGLHVRPVYAQAAAAPGAEIWAGVYGPAQAERGKAAYASYCLRCHSADLNGGPSGRGVPAIKGDNFWFNWDRASLASLFSKIQGTMPRDAPASLSNADYADILAYVLQVNSFPAGKTELTPASLGNVAIVKQPGTVTEVPNFALVRVVGCLARSGTNNWVLTNTTEPAIAREERIAPANVTEAAAMPLGSETFRLLDVAAFDPAKHVGHRVEVRGLLNKTSRDKLIDALALQMVGASCGS